MRAGGVVGGDGEGASKKGRKGKKKERRLTSEWYWVAMGDIEVTEKWFSVGVMSE